MHSQPTNTTDIYSILCYFIPLIRPAFRRLIQYLNVYIIIILHPVFLLVSQCYIGGWARVRSLSDTFPHRVKLLAAYTDINNTALAVLYTYKYGLMTLYL